VFPLLLVHVGIQMRLPPTFHCDRYAAPCVKLLTSAALLLDTSWLYASRRTRLMWLLNGNISDFSFIVNKSLLTIIVVFRVL
jgi:hypothetical protein